MKEMFWPIFFVIEAEINQAFNSALRHLDNRLNIVSPYFDGMVGRIYSPELHLKKANASDTESHFWISIYLF